MNYFLLLAISVGYVFSHYLLPSARQGGKEELQQEWQTFSVKEQVVNILGFVSLWPLLYLLSSAVTGCK
jgi:hypothetical protein